MFAASVFAAKLLNANDDAVDGLSIAFVVLRVLYLWIYISHTGKGLAALRSVVFTLGMIVVIALFAVGLAE